VSERIRLNPPWIAPGTERLVAQVLASGRLAQGPMIERFEELCRSMADTTHAIAVANGTVSLEAALAGVGIGPGTEVITSPFTFVATANSVLRTGANVRFVDVGEDLTIDTDRVHNAIGERTRAIIPVHLYGLPANMPLLVEIAESRGLAIVEDAAQAHGAEVGGRRVGGFGVGSFSFYATKNVGAGEGGVITTNDDDLASRLRAFRNQGMRGRYEYEQIGTNIRFNELAAAVAIPQLESLDEIVALRNEHAGRLSELLEGSGIILPSVPQARRHVWHQYTVLLPEEVERDSIGKAMDDAGIDVGVYYPRLLTDYEVMARHPRVTSDETPVAADAARRCLSLPVHHRLDDGDIQRIAHALTAAI